MKLAANILVHCVSFLNLSFMIVVNIPFLFVPQYQIAAGAAQILLKNLLSPIQASQSLHLICLHSTYGVSKQRLPELLGSVTFQVDVRQP